MRLEVIKHIGRCLLVMVLFTLCLEGGEYMDDQISEFFPAGWVTIKDEEAGIKAVQEAKTTTPFSVLIFRMIQN